MTVLLLLLVLQTACLIKPVADDNNAQLVEKSATETLLPIQTIQSIKTMVSQPTTLVNQPVDVACVVQDADGQLMVDIPTQIWVSARAAEATPQSVVNRQFITTRAGLYTFFCRVAGQDVQDAIGADLLVQAGLAYKGQVQIPNPEDTPIPSSGTTCYWQNRPILPVHDVVDEFGNSLPHFETRLVAEPATDVTSVEGGGLVFTRAGLYDVRVEILSPVHPQHTILAEHRVIMVNSTPPVIHIISPQRGEMVQAGGFEPYEQTIRGVILAPVSGLKSAQVDKKAQPVIQGAREVPFEVTQESRWGLSIIEATAIDMCGLQTHIVQSYLRSPAYLPLQDELAADGEIQSGVAQAFLTRINQSMIDNQQHQQLDSMAALVERLLAPERLNEVMPNNLFAWPKANATGQLPKTAYHCSGKSSFEEHKHGIEVVREQPFSYTTARVESLVAQQDGWRMAMSLQNLSLPVRVHGYFDMGCWGGQISRVFNGIVHAKNLRIDVMIYAKVKDGIPQFQVKPEGLKPIVSAADLSLTTDPNVPNNPNWAPYINYWLDHNWLRPYLERSLQAQLQQDVAKTTEIFFKSFRLQHNLQVPKILQHSMQITSGVDYLEFFGGTGLLPGHVDIGLWSSILPQSNQKLATTPAGPNMHGPICRQPALADLTLGPMQSFAIAIKDDWINQMFWSLWMIQGFESNDVGDLLAQYHPQGINTLAQKGVHLALQAKLPPVLMPSFVPGRFKIGLGDVFVKADINMSTLLGGSPQPQAPTIHLGLYVSGIFEATIKIDEQGALLLQPHADSQMRLQIVDISDPGTAFTAERFMQSELDQVLSQILSKAIKSFMLPDLHLGELPGISEPVVWRLANTALERQPQANYTVFKGHLYGIGDVE